MASFTDMPTLAPPPSRIYLLRHGRAANPEQGQRDFDRTLTTDGFAEAEIVADKAADRRYRPDAVISSTAMRCRQTAEAVRRAISETIEPEFIDEVYNGSVGTYLALIFTSDRSGSVMLVGHNPTIEDVFGELIGKEHAARALPSGYPTAGLAVIDHAGRSDGSRPAWNLTDFLTP
ncbi:phosphohistidine phosphatase [Rhizobium sp. PvP014]|jgi:phosphohistidine phosphatase|nr:phosphohistidine phosphatase [Rhizobium sp. PvP014]MBP2528675.1 phosphohistidine phosphatase [Rhizobium sp. PvP099]